MARRLVISYWLVGAYIYAAIPSSSPPLPLTWCFYNNTTPLLKYASIIETPCIRDRHKSIYTMSIQIGSNAWGRF
jgi:hypothetical protein